MKKLLLVLVSSIAFANVDLKLSLYENIFLLPENVPGFNVENIQGDILSLDIVATHKFKKKKIFGLSVIPKINFTSKLLLNESLDSNSYSLLNRDDVNEKVKDIDIEQSFLAYKKLAKKFVFFFETSFKYSDGYSLEYDLRAVGDKTFDYFLISNEYIRYSVQTGFQTKLLKNLRLDGLYNISLSDYKYDYSIYDINDGQSDDHISHLLAFNLGYNFSKNFSMDSGISANYKIYKNKLALKQNGFIITQGLVDQEELLDYSVKHSSIYRYNKLKFILDLDYFSREDRISGARDVEVKSIKFTSFFKVDDKVYLDLGYKVTQIDYANLIASLQDESLTELLNTSSRSLEFGLNYEKFNLSYKNFNNDSTREYDTLDHNIYSISYRDIF